MSARRILFLSHSHAFGPFRVGSHHYARALAADGADVVHLSTPISFAHRITGRISRETLAEVPRGPHHDGGVTHLVPRTLLPVPYARFSVRRELARHGLPTQFDAIVLDQPLLWSDSLRGMTTRLIYRPTDLYPDGVKHMLQQRILAAADGVIATSSEVLRGLGAQRVPSLVIANGVDAARFTSTDTAERPAVAAYVGALDSRFDWGQLAAWATAHPDVRFAVAGPHGSAPEKLPDNIDLLGAVAYDELPALLHGARVGLLPLSDDLLNAGRSPMKLYEYLAAGLAVVTRETPVLRADSAVGLFTYAGAGDADDAFRQALEHASPNLSGVTRAANESWSAKAGALRSFIFGI